MQTHGADPMHWAYSYRDRHLNDQSYSIKMTKNLHTQMKLLLEERDGAKSSLPTFFSQPMISVTSRQALSMHCLLVAASLPPSCTGVDCSGHGSCYPHSRPNQEVARSYFCECDAGFTGSGRTLWLVWLSSHCFKLILSSVDCEKDLDECESSPCQNGGVCKESGSGFIGYKRVKDKHGIEQKTGVSVAHADYRCSCKPGFFGDNCDVETEL
eukprot:SAG31_NODE_1973_length_6757_cov_1.653950_7_plen_212_part_00